MRLDPGDIL